METLQALPIPALRNPSRRQNNGSATQCLAVAALAFTLLALGAAQATADGDSDGGGEGYGQSGFVHRHRIPTYKSATSERREKLREVIAPRFDFTDMARSAMGYHWRTLSQAQRDQFAQLFTGLLEASYMGKIERLQGPGRSTT